MKIYYLNRERFEKGDTTSALNSRDYIATTIRLLMDGNENYKDLVPMSIAV